MKREIRIPLPMKPMRVGDLIYEVARALKIPCPDQDCEKRRKLLNQFVIGRRAPWR